VTKLRTIARRAGAIVLVALAIGQQAAGATEAVRQDIRTVVRDFRALDSEISMDGTDLVRIVPLLKHQGPTVRKELTELSAHLATDLQTESDTTFRAAYRDMSQNARLVADTIERMTTALPDAATAAVPPGQLTIIQQAVSAYTLAANKFSVSVHGYERQLEKLSLTTISLDDYHLGYVYFWSAVGAAVLFVGTTLWSLVAAARGVTEVWFARLGLTVVTLWAFVGAAATYGWFWLAQRRDEDLLLVWIPLVIGLLRLLIGIAQYRQHAQVHREKLQLASLAAQISKHGSGSLHTTGPVPLVPLHDHPAVGLLSDARRPAMAPVTAAPTVPPPPTRAVVPPPPPPLPPPPGATIPPPPRRAPVSP
jgi:hypothetical protein